MSGGARTAEEAEVIVVGAGPAGSSCAALLAEQGHEVLLVDQSRFPREKPCGDGLTRSAVTFLDRIGLDGLIEESQPIEGLRMVIEHRTVEYRAYAPSTHSPHRARCIRRGVLDEALVQLARSRGARFLQARVLNRANVCEALGVRALVGSEECVLRSRFVVAADGATSRLRRMSGHGRLAEELSAYAVRAYYRCERPLEPVFDTYMPLEFEGATIAGYGWVFPIDAHTANIGVGYWRGLGITSPKRIRDVLGSFVEQLGSRVRSRFGEIERISKLSGSPLGVQFRRDRCEANGMVFVGDAARMTDPWSGEGIAYALHGAEQIAGLVHARARGRQRSLHAGTVLGRRFARLGQELSFPLRVAERRLNHAERYATGKAPHPFLRTVQNIITAPEDEPSLIGTPAGAILARDPRSAARLERVNEILLDELQTGFPFAAELLHREVRAGVGPILAAMTLLPAPEEPEPAGVFAREEGEEEGREGEAEERLLAAASALELIGASAFAVRETVDRPRGRSARLNNAFCVLVADFALSRGARQAARAGAWLTRELSAVMKGIYESQFTESQQFFDSGRSVQDYLAVARARMSAPLALAARFAARTAHQPPAVVEALDAFGWELGPAVQICEDLEDLIYGDRATGRAAGMDLRLGAYPLPVLCVAEDDREFRRLLQGASEAGEVAALVDRMISVGAMGRTVRIASASVESARAALGALRGCEGLQELATRVQERTLALAEGG